MDDTNVECGDILDEFMADKDFDAIPQVDGAHDSATTMNDDENKDFYKLLFCQQKFRPYFQNLTVCVQH